MKADSTIPARARGANPEEGLVACEHRPGTEEDRVILFRRSADGGTETVEEAFHPFLWVESAELAARIDARDVMPLDGDGDLRVCTRFSTWRAMESALRALKKITGRSPSMSDAPYHVIADPVQQHLMLSGRTLFKGLPFSALRRVVLDVETHTSQGFDFPNAGREGDAVIAVGLADSTGATEMFSRSPSCDEPLLLRRVLDWIAARDPDVLIGHNLFGFDLPYLAERCRRHGIAFALGRGGGLPSVRAGRFTAADYTQNYDRMDVWGRAVIDTYFLAQLYDVSHRSLPGYGLKEVARHFGLAREGRRYIEGSVISAEFDRDPAAVLEYLGDDVRETGALASLLLPVYHAQARLLPMTLQNTVVRGNAAKIDALMLREYLRRGAAIPRPGPARPFEGGFTAIFHTGLARGVHHCDVRSLYPSVMLADRIGPASDRSGVFLDLLRDLRDARLEAKDRARSAPAAEREGLEAYQGTLKILINSFYGYLGFAMARFNDFDAAERVTARGREILKQMIAAIERGGGRPVEIDTDGIYFLPPPASANIPVSAFRQAVASALPEGIEVEFDGEYEAMFSYKMKNYALLDANGEITIRGAALKSRGLEPYLRDFIEDWLRLKLSGDDDRIPELADRYRRELSGRVWPIERLARTERLQDSPAAYAARVKGKGRGRSAAYELALASNRDFRAGDFVTYYVTGDRKSVPVHSAARFAQDWNASRRDENTAFYLAKLDDLVKKLAGAGEKGGDGHAGNGAKQTEFNLGDGT